MYYRIRPGTQDFGEIHSVIGTEMRISGKHWIGWRENDNELDGTRVGLTISVRLPARKLHDIRQYYSVGWSKKLDGYVTIYWRDAEARKLLGFLLAGGDDRIPDPLVETLVQQVLALYDKVVECGEKALNEGELNALWKYRRESFQPFTPGKPQPEMTYG